MGSQVLGLEKRLSKYQQSSSMNSVTGRAVRPSAGEARKKERKDAFLQKKTQVMSEDSHPLGRTEQLEWLMVY